MINSQQIRAARGLIGLSQADLAKAVGLSTTALNQIERGLSTPRASNIQAIYNVLSQAGIEFLPQSGIRLKANTFFSLEGSHCLSYLLEDIYNVLSSSGGTVSVMGVSDRDFAAADIKAMGHYYKRSSTADIHERVIVEEGDDFFLFPDNFTTYRSIAKSYFYSLPFYLYGTKLAFLIWGDPIKLIIIDDINLHSAFTGLFELTWQQAQPVTHINSHFK